MSLKTTGSAAGAGLMASSPCCDAAFVCLGLLGGTRLDIDGAEDCGGLV